MVSKEQSWPKAVLTKEELFHLAVRNREEFGFHRFHIRGYF